MGQPNDGRHAMMLFAVLPSPDAGYLPIAVLFLVVTGLAAVILLLTHFLPKKMRSGPVKDAIYESGVEPIGDARRRFNIRFYLVAMLFLLFDVELIFMYPWAVRFYSAAMSGEAGAKEATFLVVEMAIFMAVLLIGYIYAWRKKVFTVT